MEDKYKKLLANMKGQKNNMSSLYHYRSVKNSDDIASFHWKTIYHSLDAVLEQTKVAQLKAQQLQHSAPVTGKDTANLMIMLQQLHALLIDYNIVIKTQKSKELNNMDNTTTFAMQLAKAKQHIDVLSLELAKLKSVNEALDNIVTNYKLELVAISVDQENQDED